MNWSVGPATDGGGDASLDASSDADARDATTDGYDCNATLGEIGAARAAALMCSSVGTPCDQDLGTDECNCAVRAAMKGGASMMFQSLVKDYLANGCVNAACKPCPPFTSFGCDMASGQCVPQ